MVYIVGASGCWQAFLVPVSWLASWTRSWWGYSRSGWCSRLVHGRIWAGARVWMGVSVYYWARIRVVFVVAFGVVVVDMGFMIAVRSVVLASQKVKGGRWLQIYGQGKES